MGVIVEAKASVVESIDVDIGLAVRVKLCENSSILAQNLIDLPHKRIVERCMMVMESVATFCVTKLLVRATTQHFTTVFAGARRLLIEEGHWDMRFGIWDVRR